MGPFGYPLAEETSLLQAGLGLAAAPFLPACPPLRLHTSLALAGGSQALTGGFLSPHRPPANAAELFQIVRLAACLLYCSV